MPSIHCYRPETHCMQPAICTVSVIVDAIFIKPDQTASTFTVMRHFHFPHIFLFT